jgi:hypothetical protein
MTFAAGYLTDFRFVNLGCSFGERGLAITLEGLEDKKDVGKALSGELSDRRVRFKCAFDRLDVEPYLVSQVDTDRWWRLPAVRFFAAGGEKVYRPPVPLAQREEVWTKLTLRVLERLLRNCDGKRGIDDVVRATRDAFDPAHHKDIQQLCNLMLGDLSRLGLVVAAS